MSSSLQTFFCFKIILREVKKHKFLSNINPNACILIPNLIVVLICYALLC